MFAVSEEIKPEYAERVQRVLSSAYLRDELDLTGNSCAVIAQAGEALANAKWDIVEKSRHSYVDIPDSKNSVKSITTEIVDSDVSIGDNVLLIGCRIRNSSVVIPSNTVMVDVTIVDSTVILKADAALLVGSVFSDSHVTIAANILHMFNSRVERATLDCKVKMFVTVDAYIQCTSEDADNRTVVEVLAPGKQLIIDRCRIKSTRFNLCNPKVFIHAERTNDYYYRQGRVDEIRYNLEVHRNSTTYIDSAYRLQSVCNKGVLTLHNFYNNSVQHIVIGKNSKLKLDSVDIPWYNRDKLKLISIGDNVVAMLHKIRGSTAELHVKDNFVGVITRLTGTKKGNRTIVRAVHGS